MLAQHVDYAMALTDERGWDDDVLTVGSSFGGCAAIELLARESAREVIAFAPPWAPGRGYCSARPGLPLTRPPARSADLERVVSRPRLNGFLVQGAPLAMAIDDADMLATLDSWARFLSSEPQ